MTFIVFKAVHICENILYDLEYFFKISLKTNLFIQKKELISKLLFLL